MSVQPKGQQVSALIRLPFGWRFRRHVYPLNSSTRLAGEPVRYSPRFFRVRSGR